MDALSSSNVGLGAASSSHLLRVLNDARSGWGIVPWCTRRRWLPEWALALKRILFANELLLMVVIWDLGLAWGLRSVPRLVFLVLNRASHDAIGLSFLERWMTLTPIWLSHLTCNIVLLHVVVTHGLYRLRVSLGWIPLGRATMTLVTVATGRVQILLLTAASSDLVEDALRPLIILLQLGWDTPAVFLRFRLSTTPVRAVHGLATARRLKRNSRLIFSSRHSILIIGRLGARCIWYVICWNLTLALNFLG